MIRLCVCVVGLFFAINTINAQNYSITKYGIDQGLPTLFTKSVTQDYNGLIWVGTDQGVVTFDGYTFKQVKGVPVSYMKHIYRNGDQTLQILSDNGIHQIEIKSGRFETRKLFQSDTLESETSVNFPKRILEDTKNRKWYIEYRGIAKEENGKLTHYTVPEKYITSSYVNPYYLFENDHSTHDFVLINQKMDVFLFNDISGDFQVIHEQKRTNEFVNSIIKLSENEFLVATNLGLKTLSIHKQKVNVSTTPIKGYITTVFQKTSGELLAFYRDGKVLLSKTGFISDFKQIEIESIPASNTVYEDGDQNLWVATDYGLYMIEETVFQTINAQTDFPYVQFLSKSDSTVYAVINNKAWEIHFNESEQVQIRQIKVDSDVVLSVTKVRNRVIVGDSNGELHIVEAGKANKKRSLKVSSGNQIHNPSIFNMQADSKGRIWINVGELNGIYVLKQDDSIEFFGESQGLTSRPLDIVEGKDGYIYASGTSTTAYLFRFDEINNRFENLTAQQELTSPEELDFSVHQMDVDNTGSIWLASSYGVYTYKNGTVKKEKGFDDFPNYLIKSIAVDTEEGVWIGAENGLFLLRDGQLLKYEEKDGLKSLSINYRSLIVDNMGRLFVGTNDGLSFQKATHFTSRQTPAPYVQKVKIGGLQEYIRPVFIQDVDVSQDIEFEFISYIYPQSKTFYQYRLNHQKWSSFSQENSITLRNFEVGDYTIEFRAINRGHGISNSNVLSFSVLPIWYLRWYMKLLYALVTALILWFAQNYWKSSKNELRISRLLYQTEYRLQLVLNSSPIILFAIDNQLNFTLFSGKSADEFIEKTGIKPKHVNQIFPAFSDSPELIACQNGSEQVLTLQVEDKIFDARLLPVLGRHGKVSEVIGICIDITSRIQTEVELLKAKNNAEKANAAKSIFLANMSHELRTPLNAIMGFASLLVRQKTDVSQQKKYLNTIYSSGEHLLLMINDILDLSKIESGKMDIYLETVDVIELINEMENLFQVQSQRKKLLYETYIDEYVPKFIVTDQKKLRQILINLIGNGIKYTGEGSVTIRLSANFVKKKLIFEVIDTGVGIPESQLKQIFDPFKQVNTSYSDGTGLGLSIVKGMADLLGGSISVISKVGSGSIFTLELPLSEVSNKTNSISPVDSADLVQKFKVKTGLRALVVDDKFENRELMSDYLIHFGFDVIKAENGLEAVKQVQQHVFDVIMLDIYMPVMDGKSAFKKIKELQPELPVIAVSAGGFEEFKHELESLGFHGFLHKPFKDIDLIQILRRVVELDSKAVKLESAHVKTEPEDLVVSVHAALLKLDSKTKRLLIDAIDLMDFDSLTDLIKSHELEKTIKEAILEKIEQKDFRFFIQLSEQLQ
ncbi:response regulator [bacterium]|nr:MAG: response regulator [bacterium]